MCVCMCVYMCVYMCVSWGGGAASGVTPAQSHTHFRWGPFPPPLLGNSDTLQIIYLFALVFFPFPLGHLLLKCFVSKTAEIETYRESNNTV